MATARRRHRQNGQHVGIDGLILAPIVALACVFIVACVVRRRDVWRVGVCGLLNVRGIAGVLVAALIFTGRVRVTDVLPPLGVLVRGREVVEHGVSDVWRAWARGVVFNG